jgi:O-antigen/teichoic acid export membrane protein
MISDRDHGARLAGGALLIFTAEVLALAAGVLVFIALAGMGPAAYGLYALAMAIVTWIEWTIVSLFARITIRAVGDAEAWEPVAAGALRLHVAVGLGAAVLLAGAAQPLAALMGVPPLAQILRLLALDIPIFAASWVHWHVAAGRGLFRARALGSLGRSLARLIFIGACLQLGLSVFSAVLATIAASTLELALARRLISIPIRSGSLMVLRVWGSAVWILGASAVAMRLFDKLDLFLLKALGAPLDEIGIYAIAQTLCVLPPLVAMALGPSLLGMSARLRAEGRFDAARMLERESLGVVFWLVPVAAFIAVGSRTLVVGLFGPMYGDAGFLLSILIFAAVAQALVAVCGVILTASDRMGTVLMITTSLVTAALCGHWFAIPRWGSYGAALVTCGVSIAGACVTLTVLHVALGVTPIIAFPQRLRGRWSWLMSQRA